MDCGVRRLWLRLMDRREEAKMLIPRCRDETRCIQYNSIRFDSHSIPLVLRWRNQQQTISHKNERDDATDRPGPCFFLRKDDCRAMPCHALDLTQSELWRSGTEGDDML